MEEAGEAVKRFIKKLGKSVLKKVLPIVILVAFICILIASFTYRIMKWEATEVAEKSQEYLSNVKLDDTGKFETGISAKELWDKLIKEGYDIEQYLNNSSELEKLMNAELVTQLPDLRDNTDDLIDVDELFSKKRIKVDKELASEDQKEKSDSANDMINLLQGIIRFKRYDKEGNSKYITYASPQTFNQWIEQYETTGDRAVRDQIMSHFTLKKKPKTNSTKGITGSGGKAIAQAAVRLACSLAEGKNQNLFTAATAGTRIEEDNTREYVNARDSVIEGRNTIDGGDYASCDAAVATAVRYSGVDPNMEFETIGKIWTYLRGSEEWQDVGEYTRPNEPTNLQPGDVLISGEPYGHIFIYVGNEAVREKYPDSKADAYEAGYSSEPNQSYYPRLFEITVDERNNITYTIFRHISANNEDATQVGQTVINYAKSKLGCNYVWGAEGPNEFDCSGLTMCAYREAGVSIAHYDVDQCNDPKFEKHSVDEAKPGDILWKDGHVGIYIGNREYIHAANPSRGVVQDSLDSWNPWVYALHYPGNETVTSSGTSSGKSSESSSGTNSGASNTGGPSIEDVIAAAESQLGQPYPDPYEGSCADPGGKGFDCSGLVFWSFEQAGFENVPHAQYSGTPSMYETVKENCGGELITDESKLQRGDLLFYNTGDGRVSGHVAIYLGDGKRIHSGGKGVGVVEDDRALGQKNDSFIGGGPLFTNVSRSATNQNTNSNSSSPGYQAVIATYTEIQKYLDADGPDYEGAAESFGVSLDTTTEYIVKTTNVDYETLVEPYTLQFEFLWALLVIGQDKNFVMDLAKLAYKSEITVGIYDNSTETTDIDRWTYKQVTNAWIKGSVSYDNPSQSVSVQHDHTFKNGNPLKEEDGHIYKTVVTNTGTIKYALARANTWIADYSIEYDNTPPNSNTTTGEKTLEQQVLQPITEVDYHEDTCGVIGDAIETLRSRVQGILDSRYQAAMRSYNKDNGGSPPNQENYQFNEGRVKENITMTTKVKRVKIHDSTEDTVVTTKYVAKTPSVIMKVDKTTKPNFVTLFNAYKYRENKNNILSAVEWLFEIMEENEDLANTTTIFKYLLYKATGTNFGVTEFDFEEYLASFASSSRGAAIGGSLSITECSLTKDEFINLVQSYSAAVANYATQEFRDGAATIYDICMQEHLNPILCAAQAWQEQGWNTPVPGNYWGIGVYNGMQDGIHYDGISGGVKGWCKHVNGILSGDGDSADVYRESAARYSTVNSKFKGDMSSMYDVFSAWAYIGDGYSLQAEADYAAEYVESICQCANQIFGEGILKP